MNTKKVLIKNIVEQKLINLICKNSNYQIGNIIEIKTKQYNKFLELSLRFGQEEPLDYILGQVELNNLRFYLNKSTFIPRPCTSELIKIIQEDSHDSKITLIDICAGSGYIGLSLANYFDQVILVEKSKRACDSIIKSADYNKIKNFKIYNIDAFKFDYSKYKNYIIVCNPPYVPSADFISNTSVSYEPKVAIYSGSDGLTFFRKLIKIMSNNLPRQIYLELDPRNILTAQSILNTYYKTKIIQDSEGFDRFLIGY